MNSQQFIIRPNVCSSLLRSWIVTLSALLCSVLLSRADAAPNVNPPPDGCYPNYTTAEGCNALAQLGGGIGNSGLGAYALFMDISGNYNTGVGAAALALNAADGNTAIGTAALLLNTIGTLNTATGAKALYSNTEGSFNTANGAQALFSNNTGGNNTASGMNALFNNTTGNDNTATGVVALFSNDTGSDNTATGYQALYHNTTGGDNTAHGMNALVNNIAGSGNTAIGFGALQNSDSDSNTAVGDGALGSENTGAFNTAIGAGALSNDTSGYNNVAIGLYAGQSVTTGSNNIYIANSGTAQDESETIRIGNGNTNATYVGGVAGRTVGAGGTTCYVDNLGKLGVFLSARRYKENIQPMNEASSALYSLKPVTFRYKPEFDKSGTPQFGLIAEEVAAVNPDLVVRNAKGEISTVRYEAVNVLLLNEFLKEHKKVEEQQATIVRLENAIETIVAHSKAQDQEIQRVRDQVQMNGSDAKAVVAGY